MRVIYQLELSSEEELPRHDNLVATIEIEASSKKAADRVLEALPLNGWDVCDTTIDEDYDDMGEDSDCPICSENCPGCDYHESADGCNCEECAQFYEEDEA